MNAPTITPAPVRKTLSVKATPEHAFRIFTEGFDRWWPRSHSVGGSPMARAVIEPRTGGRWYEVGENGAECQWGEVLAWEPPHRVMLAWRISADWKADPEVYSELEVRFTPQADGTTRVDLEHRKLEGLGAKADELRVGIDGPGGWGALLAEFQSAAEG
jgi:uncharacterized protein YndB with AHSA1/START domain